MARVSGRRAPSAGLRCHRLESRQRTVSMVDEAQHAQEEQLASVTPILAVSPNPQKNYIGSAGLARSGRPMYPTSSRSPARACSHGCM